MDAKRFEEARVWAIARRKPIMPPTTSDSPAASRDLAIEVAEPHSIDRRLHREIHQVRRGRLPATLLPRVRRRVRRSS